MEILPMPISEANMLTTGLRLVGFSDGKQITTSLKKKEEVFVSWFGSLPKRCCALWHNMTTIRIENEAILDKPELKYLLMTLYWLFCYNKLMIIASIFHLHEDTVGKWVWIYATALQKLKDHKVHLS
jgi:hypothetical protein